MSVSPPPNTTVKRSHEQMLVEMTGSFRFHPDVGHLPGWRVCLLINSSLSWREPVWMKPSKSFLCISADQWGGGGIKDGKTENAGNRNGFIIPLMAFIMRETRIISNPLYSLVFVIWEEAGAPETALTKVCGALTRWGRWWFDDG